MSVASRRELAEREAPAQIAAATENATLGELLGALEQLAALRHGVLIELQAVVREMASATVEVRSPRSRDR